MIDVVVSWLNANLGAVQAASAVVAAVSAILIAIYVILTWKIAGAAKESAEASRQMAEEMERQRMTGMMPVVVPGIRRAANKRAVDEEVPAEATVHNYGNGPAFVFEVFVVNTDVSRQALIDAVATREFPYGRRIVSSTPSTLVQGAGMSWDLSWDALEYKRDDLICVEYGDIYDRRFRSGFVYRFSSSGPDLVNTEIVPPTIIGRTSTRSGANR